MKNRVVWIMVMGLALGLLGAAHAQPSGAERWRLPEAQRVVGIVGLGEVGLVATDRAVFRREGEKLEKAWTAPGGVGVAQGPLVEGNRIFILAGDQLWSSALGATLAFRPVAVGAEVWALPRRVHDRWFMQTDKGVRQSRDLQKWEALPNGERMEARHLVWHDNAWWTLATPPPAIAAKADADGEEEDEDGHLGMGGGRLGAAVQNYELRRSTDLRAWRKVREVEASLISVGLFSFGGKLVEIGEAGVSILPRNPEEEIIMPDASEEIRGAVTAANRLWLITGGGVLVSGENDPTQWSWMDGYELSRELSSAPSALATWGDFVAIGSERGQVIVLAPSAQTRLAAGSLAFGAPTVGSDASGVFTFPDTVTGAAEVDGVTVVVTTRGAWRRAKGANEFERWLESGEFSDVVARDGEFFAVRNGGLFRASPTAPNLTEVRAKNQTPRLERIAPMPDGGWLGITKRGLANVGGKLVERDGHAVKLDARNEWYVAGSLPILPQWDGQNWWAFGEVNAEVVTLRRGDNPPFGDEVFAPKKADAISSVAVGNDVVLIASKEGLAAVPTDVAGDQLKELTFASWAQTIKGRVHVARIGEKFWAWGESGGVLVSSDGRNWLDATASLPAAVTRVVSVSDQPWALTARGVVRSLATALPTSNGAFVMSTKPQGETRTALAQRRETERAQALAASQVASLAAKREAETTPRTVSGAQAMAAAFLWFERNFVSGASRRELAESAVKLHETVAKHRPALANELAETIAITVINLAPNDLRTAAYLAHHMPGFRNRVQALYGKSYSSVYWEIQRAKGQQVTREFEIDVMKELLMSYTDNSYLRRVTFPKIPQNYPTFEPDAKRMTVALVKKENLPFTDQTIRDNLEKGWAGAAVDRDVQHAGGLDVRAAKELRPMWLLAARALWPGTMPQSNQAMFDLSFEEKARAGSLLAADQLALDARKAGKSEEFAWYRDLAVQRGMVASRYQNYADATREMIEAIAAAQRNTTDAMASYQQSMDEANKGFAAALEARDALLRGETPKAAVEGIGNGADLDVLFARGREQVARGMIVIDLPDDWAWLSKSEATVLKIVEGSDGESRFKERVNEGITFRKIAVVLHHIAEMSDVDGTGRATALANYESQIRRYAETRPKHYENALGSTELLKFNEPATTREQKKQILDRVLRELPTLANLWALRAELFFDDGERARAEGMLAVARWLNPAESSVVKVSAKMGVAKSAPSSQQANALGALLVAAHERSVERVREGDAAFAQGRFAAAKETWEAAEKAPNSEATLRLVLIFAEGLSVAKDLPAALKLVEKAKQTPQVKTRAEVVERQVRRLMQANVSAADVAQARTEMFKAVGIAMPTVNPDAEFQLGRDYEEGRKGGTANERTARAVAAYRRAADADHVPAIMALVRVLNAELEELSEIEGAEAENPSSRRTELTDEIKTRIVRAANLGNGEALRIHALWIAQGQMGGDAPTNARTAFIRLQAAANAGDLVAMRLLIRAAQAGEWNLPPELSVEKLIEKLAAAGEADAIALLKQRDQQKTFNREFWGERGVPTADPAAKTAPVPTEAVVVNGVPRSLLNHLQLSRPTSTTARSFDAARNLVVAMMADERIDATERAILSAAVKPSFRLKLMQPADAQGAARELVFLGSYEPQARAFLERFIPAAGSDRPEVTPLMRRYFWIWTGAEGWQRAAAHAQSGATGRREMIDALKGWLGEKWSTSNIANNYGPLRDELSAIRTALAQIKGPDYEIGRSLVLESCQELDKELSDVVPDFLYAEFNAAGAAK